MPIYPADVSEHNEVWEKHLAEIVKCPSQAIGHLYLVKTDHTHTHTYKTKQIYTFTGSFLKYSNELENIGSKGMFKIKENNVQRVNAL